MTKHLLFLAVAALALTACTSEEMINDVKTSSSNAIKFENVVNKHTRADLTSSTLTHFNVFGFYTMPGNAKHAHKVFDEVPVERADENSEWEYTVGGERYWIPGAKYYFYAYSCDNKGISDALSNGIAYDLNMDNTGKGKDASERVLEIQNYVCNNVHQHDLIFASNTGAVEGDQFAGIEGKEYGENNPVALQFSHILSKIKAKFTTEFPTEYQIVISNISIKHIPNKGNYDVVNGWHSRTNDGNAMATLDKNEGTPLTLLGENNILTLWNEMVGEEGNKQQMSVETEPFYVIPVGSDEVDNPVKVYLEFTIDAYIGDDRTEKVMSKTLNGEFTPTWSEGCQYVYNIKINGETTKMDVIAFTTGVDAFGDPLDIDDEPEPTEFVVTNNSVND